MIKCVQLCKECFFLKLTGFRYVYQKFCSIMGTVAENFENNEALLEFQSVQSIFQGLKLTFFRSHGQKLLMIFWILTLMFKKLQIYWYHFFGMIKRPCILPNRCIITFQCQRMHHSRYATALSILLQLTMRHKVTLVLFDYGWYMKLP